MSLSPTSSRQSSSGGSQTLLASQVLGTTQATFDTNVLLGGAIPATYNHLRIVTMLRDDSLSNSVVGCGIQFNADAAGNYDQQYGYANGATLTAAAANASTLAAGFATQGGCSAGLFTVNDLLIHDYARTVAQKMVVLQSCSVGGAGTASTDQRMWMLGGKWRNTAAITRIVVLVGAQNFAAGSTYYLYGVT